MLNNSGHAHSIVDATVGRHLVMWFVYKMSCLHIQMATWPRHFPASKHLECLTFAEKM